MTVIFQQKWKISSIPGGIQMSSRQTFDGNFLTEEIILEESPLSLARADRACTYDFPAPRRRK
jgi:hypothetical protein